MWVAWAFGKILLFQDLQCVLFQAEALSIPTSARLDRISEFLRFGPVNFDTLVLHTGSGDIVPLSNYFNRHLTKLDELNDLFYGHSAQEDGIVPSQVQINDFPDNISMSDIGPWVERARTGDAKYSR